MHSLEDATVYVKNNLKSVISGMDAAVINGGIARMSIKLFLYASSKSVPTDRMLAKLVKASMKSDKYNVPLVNLYKKKGVPYLSFRLPEIADNDKTSLSSMESVLTLMHYCTGVDPKNMSYVMDKSLGTSLVFEKVHNKLIDELTSSASLPTGLFPGEVYKLGNYQGNLPNILASIRFLNRRSRYLRKLLKVANVDVKAVSVSELRDTFNKKAGLVDKSRSYPIQLFKSCLGVITGVTNVIFPGGWISSNRSVNRVKADNGLLFKLGYKEVIPYDHKLKKVLETIPVLNSDKVLTLQTKKPEETSSFVEFRTGVVLSSPKLSTKHPKTMDEQRTVNPLSCIDEQVIENFNDNNYHKLIDSLDKAHAMLVSISNRDKKTKPIHYQIARNELLHMSARVPIKTGLGNKVTKISSLDTPVLEYLSKLYRFKLNTKRSIDEVEDDAMVIEETVKPLPKVPKTSASGKEATSNNGGNLSRSNAQRKAS